MLVYDITSRETFNHLESWMRDIKTYAPEEVITVLVGNKSDLESHRAVPKEEAKVL